jgi:hypothetical protein
MSWKAMAFCLASIRTHPAATWLASRHGQLAAVMRQSGRLWRVWGAQRRTRMQEPSGWCMHLLLVRRDMPVEVGVGVAGQHGGRVRTRVAPPVLPLRSPAAPSCACCRAWGPVLVWDAVARGNLAAHPPVQHRCPWWHSPSAYGCRPIINHSGRRAECRAHPRKWPSTVSGCTASPFHLKYSSSVITSSGGAPEQQSLK